MPRTKLSKTRGGQLRKKVEPKWAAQGKKLYYYRINSFQQSLTFFEEHLCRMRFLSLGLGLLVYKKSKNEQCYPFLKSRMLEHLKEI